MRILIFCGLIALLAGAGCFHKKAAAPQENFSDVPGLPASPPVQQTTSVKRPKKVRQPKKTIVQTNAPAAAVEVTRNPKPGNGEGASSSAISTPGEPKTSAQKLIVTPENGLVGKVEMVNQSARYVVLSFPIGHLPAMEQRLSVYRRGLKIGEVKVSGPQIEDNVVADIVAGDSEPGDEVRDK
jgi:hypothetical protein